MKYLKTYEDVSYFKKYVVMHIKIFNMEEIQIIEIKKIFDDNDWISNTQNKIKIKQLYNYNKKTQKLIKISILDPNLDQYTTKESIINIQYFNLII